MPGESRNLTLIVPRERAEAVRKFVRDHSLFDPTRSIGREGDKVHIPVLLSSGSSPGTEEELAAALGADVRIDREGAGTPSRQPRGTPFSAIRDRLADVLGPRDISYLPDRWELFGDGLVIKVPKDLDPFVPEVCRVYASVLGARFVMVDVSGISGELRLPGHVIGLAPARGTTEVVHTENGIKYAFDMARIMFSSGNVAERAAAATVLRDVPLRRPPSGPGGGEVVYDMFAGIGYFSLPMAKGAPAASFVSCEKNPASFVYLQRNIALNGLEGRILPVLGDCRTAMPRGRADRIVMGYVGGTVGFIGSALGYLSRQGGVVHLHDTVKVDLGAEGLFEKVREEVSRSGRDAELIGWRRVKSYAPRTDHVVLDVMIGPGPLNGD